MVDNKRHSKYNIITVGEYEFEWDPAKAAVNKQKHGVSFEDAAWAFDDAGGMMSADPDHSDEEDRYLLLAMSKNGELVLVSFCFRDSDRLRLISARKATKNEERVYGRKVDNKRNHR